eukprot:295018-Prymnesium_polylepis.1
MNACVPLVQHRLETRRTSGLYQSWRVRPCPVSGASSSTRTPDRTRRRSNSLELRALRERVTLLEAELQERKENPLWLRYLGNLYDVSFREAPRYDPDKVPIVYYGDFVYYDAGKVARAMGAAGGLPPPPVPNHTRIEVLHFHSGTAGKDHRDPPNAGFAPDRWARWLYAAPGSGVFFDVGRSLAFEEHMDATLHFNASACPSRTKTRC